MKLPNRNKATVPTNKLTKYLLSETHPRGKSKARFFLDAGFKTSNYSALSKALKKVAQNADVTGKVSSVHGEKYVLDAMIESPTGKTMKVRTIWIIDKGQKRPRFVTAYPV